MGNKKGYNPKGLQPYMSIGGDAGKSRCALLKQFICMK